MKTLTITKINRGSDFDFAVCLAGVGQSDFDGWVFPLSQSLARFPFGRQGGQCRNCAVDADDMVRVFCDNAHFPPGRLAIKYAIHIPDENYADGFRTETETMFLPIEIVSAGCGCDGGSVTVGDGELIRRINKLEERVGNLTPSEGDIYEGMTAEEGRELALKIFGGEDSDTNITNNP